MLRSLYTFFFFWSDARYYLCMSFILKLMLNFGSDPWTHGGHLMRSGAHLGFDELRATNSLGCFTVGPVLSGEMDSGDQSIHQHRSGS